MSTNESRTPYQRVRDAYDGLGPQETPEDNPLDEYRYPDAGEASQYFETAEQANPTAVDVEASGYQATIIGEEGWRWWVFLRVSGSQQVFAPALLTVPGGCVADVDEDEVKVELAGMCEHSHIYGIVRDLLAQLDEMDVPHHYQQAKAVENYLKNRTGLSQEDYEQ